MSNVICPKCGKEAREIETEYGIKNVCCSLWSWGEGNPLVDEKTHRARIRAHEYFDPLWKSGLMSRTKAYKWLAKNLGIRKDECHMKDMNHKTARKVVTLCRNFKKLRV